MKTPRSSAFTLIELMIVIAIIAIIAAIAIPNLISARKHGNETAAIGALKTISSAQELFKSGDKDGNDTPDYGSLAQLSSTQLIDQVLGSGSKQGYSFAANADRSGGGVPTDLWAAYATPSAYGTSGDRSFWISQQQAIYYTSAATVGVTPHATIIAAFNAGLGIDPNTQTQIRTVMQPVGK